MHDANAESNDDIVLGTCFPWKKPMEILNLNVYYLNLSTQSSSPEHEHVSYNKIRQNNKMPPINGWKLGEWPILYLVYCNGFISVLFWITIAIKFLTLKTTICKYERSTDLIFNLYTIFWFILPIIDEIRIFEKGHFGKFY